MLKVTNVISLEESLIWKKFREAVLRQPTSLSFPEQGPLSEALAELLVNETAGMGRPHWGWGCFSPRPPGPPPAMRGLWPQARTHLCSTGHQRQAWPAMPFGAPRVIPRVSIWGPGRVERRGLGGRSPGFPELGSRTFLRGSHHSCCNWNWRGTGFSWA